MKISYGPPGHKGVTHLVAIGAAELEQSQDRMLRIGGYVSLMVYLTGAAMDKPTVKTLGLGAVLALAAVRLFGGTYGSKNVVIIK